MKLGVPSSMKVRSERYIPCHRQLGSIRIVTTLKNYLIETRQVVKKFSVCMSCTDTAYTWVFGLCRASFIENETP